MTLTIRWMMRRDMQRILEIEQACFRAPWSEHEFTLALRTRNVVGQTIDDFDDYPQGFMLYELHRDYLRLLNIAVHPQAQGQRLGAKLLDRLKSKLGKSPRRRAIVATVSEYSVGAQLFFRACGFRCEHIQRDYLSDGSDGYVMEFAKESEVPA